MKLDSETLRDLVDERLPRSQVRAIQSSYKDPDRFDQYVELLQERVGWDERIVLPFGEHLYIIAAGDRESPAGGAGPAETQYLIKCDCGHEFCDYRENWKLEALINVRDSDASLREIYPEKMAGDPEWNHLREYFCPGCKALLEVEAVPPGYPVIHDFLPDLEGFYSEWLGRELSR
ncbi:MAG: acetone carboxylase subunit gamma [Solirubrobacterales bacterium]